MANEYIYITLDNGIHPCYALNKDEITVENQQDISFGWNSIIVDAVVNSARNGVKNLIFRIPINTPIMMSNIKDISKLKNIPYLYIGKYEVKDIPDINEYNDIYYITYDDIKIKKDIYITTLTVKKDILH